MTVGNRHWIRGQKQQGSSLNWWCLPCVDSFSPSLGRPDKYRFARLLSLSLVGGSKTQRLSGWSQFEAVAGSSLCPFIYCSIQSSVLFICTCWLLITHTYCMPGFRRKMESIPSVTHNVIASWQKAKQKQHRNCLDIMYYH